MVVIETENQIKQKHKWFKMAKKKSICIPVTTGVSQEILIGQVEKTKLKWILTIDISHKAEPNLKVNISDNTVWVQGSFKNHASSQGVVHFSQEHEIPRGYTWTTREAERGRSVVTAMRNKTSCTHVDEDKPRESL
uniref:SHSP domain-containing protein n=1 Tax=Strigamia maritima TaxID=126957 RepID=T1J132_STRMM